MPDPLEPRDKLDTIVVNATEDVALVCDAIHWRLHEDKVRRLRRRIFKAAPERNLAKVRSLQKMMLRSWSNTLLSVRQVTQRNTGRVTAGIDGEVTPEEWQRNRHPHAPEPPSGACLSRMRLAAPATRWPAIAERLDE